MYMTKLKLFLIVLLLTLFALVPARAQGFPSFANLVEKLQPSVVNISTTSVADSEENLDDGLGVESSNPRLKDYFQPQKPEQVSLGSGFILDEEGTILTNNHVIDQAKEITVTLYDNRQFSAQVIGRDDKTDVALIKIEGAGKLVPVKLGDSDKIRVGDWILAIGNPFGLGGSVTAGIVSAKSRDIETGPYDNFIQTDASINQGSSGGPMFNLSGEVIGINTAIFSTSGGSMGIGFAVPVNLTKFVIRELKAKGKVERGWLGIKIQPNSTDIADSLKQKHKTGVIVSDVSENSSAQKAGVKPGDIILSFDGQDIDDTKNLSRMAAETPIGKTVTLEIWRDNKIQKLDLKIYKMPEENSKKNVKKAPVEVNDVSTDNLPELGLNVNEITPEILNQYHLDKDAANGVVITRVLSGSDAENKGLKPGDLITQVDKKAIFDVNDVKTYVNEAKLENNRPVLLLINNNNILHYVAVKLKENE